MASPDSKPSFEQSLERCLQDLARSGDIEACLKRYPQHADRLRPLLEMAQLARDYYKFVPEPPGGLLSGRERLLAAAAQQRARTASRSDTVARTVRGQGKRLTLVTRFVGVLLAVVVSLAALGGGIAWAAGGSLPGDLLYPVKITVEDARLAFTSAPRDQIDLALGFAEERVGEIQGLLETESQVTDKAVAEAIARMEGHIGQALTSAARIPSDEEMVDVLGQIVVRARAQAQALEQMQFTALQRTQAMLTQAAAVCRQGAEEAEIGQGDPRTFRSRYGHQLGEPEPTASPGMITVTPDGGQERRQGCGQGRECTPTPTPSVTRQGPQATRPSDTPQSPQPTPRRPQPTSEPQRTPRGPQSTPEPQPTSQGPQSTPEPQHTPQDVQKTPNRPQSTPHPQTTAPGPQTTPGPKATSQGPQTTPGAHSTPKGP